MSVQTVLLLWISGTAMLMDFYMERIRNGFICFGIVAALLFQIFQKGIPGGAVFFFGAAVPFIVMFPLFYFGMIGAGDIKLLSVLGGILGASKIWGLLSVSFLLGAVLALFFLLACGNFRERMSYFIHYIYQYGKTGKLQPYRMQTWGPECFHFTVPVFLGSILYAGGFY